MPRLYLKFEKAIFRLNESGRTQRNSDLEDILTMCAPCLSVFILQQTLIIKTGVNYFWVELIKGVEGFVNLYKYYTANVESVSRMKEIFVKNLGW